MHMLCDSLLECSCRTEDHLAIAACVIRFCFQFSFSF